jgi:hypothetical protein
MASDDSGPDWVLSSGPTASESGKGRDELVLAARRVWPHIHAQATRALGEKKDDPENATLAAEVWEGVLQSISRTMHRLSTSCAEISNIDSYLIGTFRHRFYRTRLRQRRREQTIQLVASINELDALAVKQGLHVLGNFEQYVLAREIFVLMDRWMRRVWTARRYGYSWKAIAIHFGLDESRVKMKFRYKLSLLRVRLGG